MNAEPDSEFIIEDINRQSTGRYQKGVVVSLLALMLIGAVWFVYSEATGVVEAKETEQRKPITAPRKTEEPPLDAFDLPVQKPEPEVREVPPVMEAPQRIPPATSKPLRRTPPAVNKWGSSTVIARARSTDAGAAASLQPVMGQTGTDSLMGVSMSAGSQGVAFRRTDLDTRINRGAHINGVMETRVDTTHSGQAACMIDREVRSADGSRVLLFPGDMMLGTYDSAMISQGVRRIALIWDLIKRYDGVEVPVNTPVTDPLGTTGLPASVDNHFWERFGGAILVSFIDVSVDEAVGGSENSGQVVIAGTATAGSSLAQEVLRNSINIKPTLFSPHGTRCATTLAHDLDFSGAVGD